MEFRAGTVIDFERSYFDTLSKYRHQVLVEMLGWKLQCHHGIETDQFDREHTLYVVTHSAQDSITGLGRLLSTTRLYLLGEVFPELLNGQVTPSSPDVWELSRMAAVDFNCSVTTTRGQFSSEIAVALLHKTIKVARHHGAKEPITVRPSGIERLLRRAGFKAHRAGPPTMYVRQPSLLQGMTWAYVTASRGPHAKLTKA